MRPLFSYYSSKWRLAKKYGAPRYSLVIEPFAGSACYSLYWNVPKAILYDLSPQVCGVWDYLIKARASEILALPVNFHFIEPLQIPQEAKWLLGFWVGKARPTPAKQRSQWGANYQHPDSCRVWSEAVRARLAAAVDNIRRWEIHQMSYLNAPNDQAHWFVDPPYETAGYMYPHNKINRAELAEFCRQRTGFVQLCGQQGETWMPFEILGTFKATNGKGRQRNSAEALRQSVA